MARYSSEAQARIVKKEDVHLTVTLFMVVASFIMCWTPMVVLLTMTSFYGTMYEICSGYSSFYAILLNTVIDPLIFMFRLNAVREEFKNTFCCSGKF